MFGLHERSLALHSPVTTTVRGAQALMYRSLLSSVFSDCSRCTYGSSIAPLHVTMTSSLQSLISRVSPFHHHRHHHLNQHVHRTHSPRPPLSLQCSRTVHLRANHDPSPQETSPDLRQRSQRCGSFVCESFVSKGTYRSPGCSEV
jgi:hypothetical protein